MSPALSKLNDLQIWPRYPERRLAVAPEQKDLDRQIADLAARADPVAFEHPADPSFEERRRAASRQAVALLRQVQTYLGMSAGVALVSAIALLLYRGQ
jgi:hypothetical protein